MTTEQANYQFESADGYSVITLQPGLNDVQWDAIEQLGNDLLEQLDSQGSTAVIVDLSSLSYMGSAMVALLVRLWKRIKQTDGQLVVVNRHPVVFEVLQIAGLTKVWPVVGSREQGVKELGVSAGGGWSTGMSVVGVLAALVAAGGLAMLISPTEQVGRRLSLGIHFGFAGLGLLVGLFSAFRGSGVPRVLGVLVILACLAVGGVGIVQVMGP